MSDQHPQQQGVSHEEYKLQHMKARIGEITGEYEERLANGAVQLQMLVQERDQALAAVEALQVQLMMKEDELSKLRPAEDAEVPSTEGGDSNTD
jgi:hypothetical protein